ncbi:MAG: hypothetical protein ACOC5T_06740 [Elusimicrobiota bacterium]
MEAILANDPSTRGWGWVVISTDGKVLDAGCIKTEAENKKRRIRKGDDDIRRVSEINSVLQDVFYKYDIIYIVSELPHGSQSASSMKMVGWVSTQMQTIADWLNIGIEWYSEGDAKKQLFGKSSATKEETIQAIDELYSMPWTKTKYINEAIADAMAIYNVAKSKSSTLKFLKKKNNGE